MNNLEKKNEQISVLGPNPNKIACRNCKWALNGAIKCNCLKYSLKPHNVYYENENCEKFASKKKLSKFSKGEEK